MELGLRFFGLALFLIVRFSLQVADSSILFAFDDILIILFVHLFGLPIDPLAQFLTSYYTRSCGKVLGLTL